MDFTIPQLAGAIGRAASLIPSGSQSNIPHSITVGAQGLLYDLIDARQPSTLAFTSDIELLADFMQSWLAGCVGVGMAHLYMESRGYAFRCNGRDLIASGPVFDIGYQGSNTGPHEVVAMEAKGSLADVADPLYLKRKALNELQRQIAPHLGVTYKTKTALTVVHGYSIATGGPAKNANPCASYIEEPAAGAVGQRQVSGAPGAVSLNWGGHLAEVNAEVAISNFKSVFRMLGGNNGGILDAMDAALRGNWLAASLNGNQAFDRVLWRKEEYIVARPQLGVAGFYGGGGQFGLRLNAAMKFAGGYDQIVRERQLIAIFPKRLPYYPLNINKEVSHADGGAEFADGLAYFGPTPNYTHQNMTWTLDVTP